MLYKTTLLPSPVRSIRKRILNWERNKHDPTNATCTHQVHAGDVPRGVAIDRFLRNPQRTSSFELLGRSRSLTKRLTHDFLHRFIVGQTPRSPPPPPEQTIVTDSDRALLTPMSVKIALLFLRSRGLLFSPTIKGRCVFFPNLHLKLLDHVDFLKE